MTIFDLDHIFVVFAAGSGGNFIAGLIKKLSLGDFSPVPISNVGSSHSVTNGKQQGLDSISFGSNPEENTKFLNLEEREKFYLDKIVQQYSVPDKVVTWSHDYTNLPLYKKHFKNCRTFTIACLTPEEKLTSILMHVNKVILSDESDIPIPVETWLFLKSRLFVRVKEKLEYLLGKNIDSKFIFDHRTDEKFKDLMFYITSTIIMNYAGLKDILFLLQEDISNVNHIPNIRNIILENSDVVLPYNYLLSNNSNLLVNSISKLFNKPLSDSEKSFIINSFENYRNKQEIDLLTDPFLYFKTKKENALQIIEQVKNNYEYYITK